MGEVFSATIDDRVDEFLQKSKWGQTSKKSPLPGGSINRVQLLQTTGGQTLVLKDNAQATAGFFQAEARGLKELAKARKADGTGGPKTPDVYLVANDFLLLEYLPPERSNWKTWGLFGQQLARMHNLTSPFFGFEANNFIGTTVQINTKTTDGFQFFAEHRLVFQGTLAVNKGLLARGDMRRLENLAARLQELIPPQPASLLHGDLWSGNIHIGENSRACLIDPAVYYGWAEADLAMAHLFGTLPRDFHEGYQSVRPLAEGYQSRFDLYNLYHLLNHLNLFGLSYLEQVLKIIRHYS